VKFEFSMKNYNKKVPSDLFFDLKNPRKSEDKEEIHSISEK